MTDIRPLVAGNWKMNGVRASLTQVDALLAALPVERPLAIDIMICPPATLLASMAERFSSSPVTIGAQDCHAQIAGAHTGDISPEMLADAGAVAVIVGHSERRTDHGESNEVVKAKAEAAHRAGLVSIVCIGETQEERSAGKALEVVSHQLEGSLTSGATPANTVIAYEPVWAIGTGLVPTPQDIAEIHGEIRSKLEGILGEVDGGRIRILYGGSVKGSNAAELMAIANVNGALVGGASLKAQDFYDILAVYAQD